jgi:hypothetical protein
MGIGNEKIFVTGKMENESKYDRNEIDQSIMESN